MIARNQWRIGVLAITWVSITLLTIYSWFSPTAGKREVKAFSFPTKIPLNSWQLVKSESLPLDNLKILEQSNRIVAAKQYSYFQDGIALDIKMRYVIGTRGNIIELIDQQKDFTAPTLDEANIKEIPQIGYYLLYSDRDRVYLSTCINSRGYTTVTSQQFSRNRYSQKLKFNLVLSWLQGKNSFRDLRCLWVQLSIPLEESSPKKAYQIITKAWIDWYHWWQPNFPSL